MAADADAPDGTLNETAGTQTAPTTSDGRVSGSPNEESPASASAADLGTAEVSAVEAEDYDTAVDDKTDQEFHDTAPAKQPMSPVRLATAVGLVAVVALAALVGWLGFRGYQSYQAQQQRELYIRVGRQGALNLTTIDWQHADTDVQRILDSATGTFYDDFSKRMKPFVDVVNKAQAKSVGTISEAGLESESGDEAQVLVAVSVKTSNLGAAEQEPRDWRMRISVQKDGDGAKVSNVAFVP